MREHRAPRIYVTASLAPAAEVRLEPGQSHYLRSVLRLGRGAKVKAFSAADGEWLCTIAESGRGEIQLTVEHQLRAAEPEGEPGLWLVFAPIKRARLVWLIEKATELGASALVPVWTARTQSGRINLERLRAHAIAASEQSERLSVPEIRVPEKLGALLTGWPAERRLIVCDETGAGEPIADGGDAAVARASGAPCWSRGRVRPKRSLTLSINSPLLPASGSARGYCAPRPPRSRRWRCSRRPPAIGAALALVDCACALADRPAA